MLILWFAAGVAALLLVRALGRWFAGTTPADLARAARASAAAAAGAAGAGLLALGRTGLALVLLAAAAAAARSLVFGRLPPDGIAGDGGGRAGEAAAEVETATLRMRLDRRTGAVTGEVRAGPLAGRVLDSLPLADVLGLLAAAGRDDPPSVALLEAYLDRRDPGWRGRAGGAGGEGTAAGAAEGGPGSGGGAMDEATALEVLGLRPGAGEAEVRDAHRRLMGAMHPDRGGSTWVAARLNQARDVLLRGRRP